MLKGSFLQTRGDGRDVVRVVLQHTEQKFEGKPSHQSMYKLDLKCKQKRSAYLEEKEGKIVPLNYSFSMRRLKKET